MKDQHWKEFNTSFDVKAKLMVQSLLLDHYMLPTYGSFSALLKPLFIATSFLLPSTTAQLVSDIQNISGSSCCILRVTAYTIATCELYLKKLKTL